MQTSVGREEHVMDVTGKEGDVALAKRIGCEFLTASTLTRVYVRGTSSPSGSDARIDAMMVPLLAVSSTDALAYRLEGMAGP